MDRYISFLLICQITPKKEVLLSHVSGLFKWAGINLSVSLLSADVLEQEDLYIHFKPRPFCDYICFL